MGYMNSGQPQEHPLNMWLIGTSLDVIKTRSPVSQEWNPDHIVTSRHINNALTKFF